MLLLVSTVWHSFVRFGTTLSQREKEIFVIFEQVNYFVELIYGNMANPNSFLSLTVTKLVNMGVETNAL